MAPMALYASDNRDFPLPDSLKQDVRFWSRIYTEVTTSEGLIHDKQHLNIVYDRLSFPPAASYKERQSITKKKKKYYKKILLDLARSSNPRLISRRHKRVKALWPSGTSSDEYQQAANNLRFQLGQADRFKEGLVRSGRWQPFIKQEFKALGIPTELASLPHVESSFRPDAASHAGASGLWQFTRSTGRRFMRIDHVVDERLDPFLATRAAGLLLKDNHEITGTWPLALTAYNHGAAGMKRAIKDTGGTDIAKIVRQYKGRTFGFASRNFYNAFVAAHDIDQNPSKYFGQVKREPAMLIHEVELPSYYTAQGLMTAFGVKNNIFKSLNPALQPTIWSNSKYIPKGYRLRLPAAALTSNSTRLIARIPGDEKASRQKADVSYKVRPGDSLSTIARRYKVKVKELVAMNGLRSRHKIRIGQVLKLPSAAAKHLKGAHQMGRNAVFYQVRKGDRLSVIARKAGVAEVDLLALNKIKNKHHLYIGQKLRLRQDPEVLSIAANEQVFKVKNGKNIVKSIDDESILTADPSNYLVAKDGSVEIQSNELLGLFADWLGVTATSLRRLNNMSAKARLVAGQRLKLEFSGVSVRAFEGKRLAYHQKIQDDFFSRFSVIKTEQRVMAKGESVWLVAQRHGVPMWLLRQYNTDVNFSRVAVGSRLIFPRLKKKFK
ncbi:MAG: LysM peptidoglycan-binding domain-containing protein [Cycloclasticus sp.]